MPLMPGHYTMGHVGSTQIHTFRTQVGLEHHLAIIFLTYVSSFSTAIFLKYSIHPAMAPYISRGKMFYFTREKIGHLLWDRLPSKLLAYILTHIKCIIPTFHLFLHESAVTYLFKTNSSSLILDRIPSYFCHDFISLTSFFKSIFLFNSFPPVSSQW